MVFLINGEYSDEECIPHSITKGRQAKGITISKQGLLVYGITQHIFYTTVNRPIY